MPDVKIPLEDWNVLKLKALFFVPKYVEFWTGISDEARKDLTNLSKRLAAQQSEPSGNGDDSISSPAERSIRSLQPVRFKKAKAAIVLMNHHGFRATEDDIVFAAFSLNGLPDRFRQDPKIRRDLANHLEVSIKTVEDLFNRRRAIYTIGKKIYDFLGIEQEVTLKQFLSSSARNKIHQVAQDENGDSEFSSAQLVPAPRTGHPWALDD